MPGKRIYMTKKLEDSSALKCSKTRDFSLGELEILSAALSSIRLTGVPGFWMRKLGHPPVGY
jgi:hypothetical protein